MSTSNILLVNSKLPSCGDALVEVNLISLSIISKTDLKRYSTFPHSISMLGIEPITVSIPNNIQIWHLGECNINFYCTQKNDIARGACAECNIIFQSAIKIYIDTKPKCHICFIICLLLIQIKYLTNLKNYAPQYQFCKVVMWPWSDQSQQRMSSRHIIIDDMQDTFL